jgi:hypothetical protein
MIERDLTVGADAEAEAEIMIGISAEATLTNEKYLIYC